jgi:hypothetical protein
MGEYACRTVAGMRLSEKSDPVREAWVYASSLPW